MSGDRCAHLRGTLAVGAVVAAVVIGLVAETPATDAKTRPPTGHPPGTGDRITVIVTADRPEGITISWHDGRNTVRTQAHVSLPAATDHPGLYTASMTFVSHSARQDLRAGVGSTGEYAACVVRVNGTQALARAAHGRPALARCG